MAILVKGKTFGSTEQVTSAKLHQLIDSATFDTGAVDDSTIALSGGVLIVKDGGITGAKLSSTVAIPSAATATTQAADTNTTAIATTAFAKKEADDAQAYAIQRANHTGTQDVSTITGLGALATLTQYESSGQSVPAANTTLTVSHGLGGVPKLWKVVLKCTTTEQGYSVGDEIDITINSYGPGSYSVTSWVDSSNIGMRYAVTPAVITKRSSTDQVAITNSNWNVVFRAWR